MCTSYGGNGINIATIMMMADENMTFRFCIEKKIISIYYNDNGGQTKISEKNLVVILFLKKVENSIE